MLTRGSSHGVRLVRSFAACSYSAEHSLEKFKSFGVHIPPVIINAGVDRGSEVLTAETELLDCSSGHHGDRGDGEAQGHGYRMSRGKSEEEMSGAACLSSCSGRFLEVSSYKEPWRKRQGLASVYLTAGFAGLAIILSLPSIALAEEDGEEQAKAKSELVLGEISLPMDKLACHRRPLRATQDGVTAETHAVPKQVVLVATGSFNPPTHMHMRMFELARDMLAAQGYDVIGAYMSPVNDSYGKAGLVPAKHRIRMCELAAQDSDFVMVDQWEARQPDYQRTLTVLRRVETEVNRGDPASLDDGERVRVMLLCGADLLESFSQPGVWIPEQVAAICGHHGLVCVTREGSDARRHVYEDDILFQHRANIHILDEWVRNDVSATEVRRNIARGQSVKYLVAGGVLSYISDHQLYAQKPDGLAAPAMREWEYGGPLVEKKSMED